MVKIDFTDVMIRDAVHCAKAIALLNNSITSGRGNVAGCLGEIALATHLGARINKNVSYNHDLTLGEATIEVKTKRRTVNPLAHYEVSVAETSCHQSPDVYAFLSLTFGKKYGSGVDAVYKDLKAVWLCGFYSYQAFFEDSRKVPRNSVDYSNGFKAHQTMYNLPIKKLLDSFPAA